MMPVLSPNTQAILLLTAPLIAGRGAASPDLLTPGEYRHLARHLREIQHQPADLMLPDAADLLRACQPVIDESRLQRLLGRGFLLSQVVEHWQTRAIWVVSRADAEYPRRFKVRLREDAPAVLYGCGDIGLLESGGLAVVGSRHVDDALIDYTIAVGRLAARAGSTLVSGGAKGIDQAAMRGALAAGGKVSGVLADSLEKTSMHRTHRNLLLDGQLVLISPYDPSAGFNVGHAMQRNKLIYALADASLVVSSDVNKGGTWAGATEQLDKLKLVPVYVRSTGDIDKGIDALSNKGAIPWPNPQNADTFAAVFDVPMAGGAEVRAQTCLPLYGEVAEIAAAIENIASELSATEPVPDLSMQSAPIHSTEVRSESSIARPELLSTQIDTTAVAPQMPRPADALFSFVRDVLLQLLIVQMKDVEVASALNVSSAQAKIWLQRLVEEGVLEKQNKPAGYIVKRKRLFE